MTPIEYIVWGIVIHLFVDWILQNEWMALNKMKRRPHKAFQRDPLFNPHHPTSSPEVWWDRHPAAYVHSGLHLIFMALVFPWWAALVVAIAHFFIDMRTPVAWWSKLIKQTQPSGQSFDIGADVRIWNDQVWHITVIALVALLISIV